MLRAAYGLPPRATFEDVTGEPASPDLGARIDDPSILDFVSLLDAQGNPVVPGSGAEAVFGIRRTTLAARLRALYGDVDHMDAVVGMLAEQHLPGAEFGQLQLAMWKRQFTALRDGDRFFYANDPALDEIKRRFGSPTSTHSPSSCGSMRACPRRATSSRSPRPDSSSGGRVPKRWICGSSAPSSHSLTMTWRAPPGPALPPAPDVLAAIARHRESEPVRRLRAALVADALPEPRRPGRPVLRLVAGGLAGLSAIAGAVLVLRPDTSHQAVRIPAGHARPTVVRAERAAPVRAARR